MNNEHDISDTIIAKSDQLNAVDLPPNGSIVKITKVVKNQTDQPLNIYLDGDNKRPYKPCLSMRRVLAQTIGVDSREWIGQSMKLFCLNSVQWGGKSVGGIRISHLSGISKEMQIPIAKNKHVRELYKVSPLVVEKVNNELIEDTVKALKSDNKALISKICGSMNNTTRKALKGALSEGDLAKVVGIMGA